LELRHLRYFVAAAAELNFTRAAARLGIAQPPLTTQIRALEHEVGVALFDRLSRGVMLTDAGRTLLTDATAILGMVDQAVRRSRLSADGVIGRVGVGFTVSAAFLPLVNGTLRTFRETFPKVELQLEESRSTELLQSLQQGRIDAAFVRPPLTLTGGLSMEMVAEEKMVAAVPLNHRLADRKIIRLQELSPDTFILYPRAASRGLSDEIIEACEVAKFEISAIQRAPQIASTINLVASGLGVSIVPACMRLSRADSVRYIELDGPPLLARLAMAFRTGEPSVAVRNFLALVRSRSAKLRV
jgi:DNA-binding transcriptional LysR family regulator